MWLLSAILACTTALLGYVLWGKSRRRRVQLVLPNETTIVETFHAIAALTWSSVTEGNRVQIIQNGAFFDALLADAASARHSIHLETFLWQNGDVSDRVGEALAACAGRGINVRVLVDQRGAAQTSSRVWARLRKAGVDFRVHHRLRLREFAWYNHRDHRKLAIIDGRVGYTFGHGIADMWTQTSGWRDTAARFEGPVVNQLQAAFFDNWAIVNGEIFGGSDYFPELRGEGTTPAHVSYLAPRQTVSAPQRLYYFAIGAARDEIILQNPYFLPDHEALTLLRRALDRGVRISVMLPNAQTSDFAIVQHASHYFYGDLLQRGARVFEYALSGLHQKVMIVDGQWCSIGSTNFDPRSFRLNDEITVAMCDREVAAILRAAFEDDRKNAREWTYQQWRDRGALHKVRDWYSTMFKRWL
jgi:cardiolipin synthase A/B